MQTNQFECHSSSKPRDLYLRISARTGAQTPYKMQAFVTGPAASTLRRASTAWKNGVQRTHDNATLPRARRARAPTCSAAPVLRAATGTIQVQADMDEIAVGDTLMIEYTPSPGSPFLDENVGTLLWTGGFNGWRGEESATDDDDRGGAAQTLHFPLMPLLNGSFRVSVMVPDYARTVDFAVSSASGFAWDDNDGQFFVIPVKYRKRLDREGEVEAYVADTGVEIKRDAKVELSESPVMMPEVEKNLHRIRGEAALIGEEKGLGNILVSQARDTFERYDHGRVGLIEKSDVHNALADMCFDLPADKVEELMVRFVGEKQCSMVEFMLIYAELELEDYGILMV